MLRALPDHLLARMLLIAAAYFVTGKLGLLLAIPPGYATAVWPPSGIALGALLVLGSRCWPGVWLGSFLTNIATSLDTSSSASIANSLALAAVIGAGAAAQAALGVALLRRWLSFPTQLTNEREVFRFMALGGPVACLVNASVSVTALAAFGAIPLNAFPYSWWTWWAGDTIGVLIFTPLVLMWVDRSGAWASRRWLVTLPLLATFAAAVLVFIYASRSEWRELQTSFNDDAELIGAALRRRVELNNESLHSIARLFAARESVEREEFMRFTTQTLAARRDLFALGWAPRVSAAERAEFERRLPPTALYPAIFERSGEDGYAAAAKRDEYLPLKYFATLGQIDGSGFDLASDPVRHETLGKARDSGGATASPPIRLQQTAARQPNGFLVAVPVYRSAAATVAARRQALLGYALGFFRTEEFIRHDDVTQLAGRRMHLVIEDTTDARPMELFRLHQASVAAIPDLRHETVLDVGGRRWLLRFTPTLEYLAGNTTVVVWLVLVAGLIFSALVGAGALILTGRTREIEALVQTRTAELAAINEQLSVEICDHIRTEVELKEERSFLKTVLDNLSEGVVVFDPQGATTLTNIAARRTHARITGKAVERNDWTVQQTLYYADGVTPIPLNALPRLRALRGETVVDFELIAVAPHRKPVALMVTSRPLLTADGEHNGAITFLRDITEARQADRMKREFISVVSHELRTPLTSIRGSLGLICGGAVGELPEKAQLLADIAYRNSHRLSLLINDILDIDKIESGHLSLDLGPHLLRSLVKQAIEANLGYAQECGVVLELLGETGEDVHVRVDAHRLLQVLANLISNAAKFSPAGARVEVATSHSCSSARVTVRDYGPGIPLEFQPRLFEKFSQADGSDTRAKSGTGLGLAISKALIERMGGAIGFESQPGAGATFHFDLPLAVAAAAAEPAQR